MNKSKHHSIIFFIIIVTVLLSACGSWAEHDTSKDVGLPDVGCLETGEIIISFPVTNDVYYYPKTYSQSEFLRLKSTSGEFISAARPERSKPVTVQFILPGPIPSESVVYELRLEYWRQFYIVSLTQTDEVIEKTGTLFIPDCEIPEAGNNEENDIYDSPNVPPVVEPPIDETPPRVELLAPDRVPEIINTMCVGKGESKQLMIVFEFEQDVIGQYEVFVDDIQYKQETVAHPRRLFFFGTAPPDGGMPHILVQSLPNYAVVFDVTDYEVPQCNVERQNNGGGDGDYVPPPINE